MTTTVTTTSGRVSGLERDGVRAWLGIPYAAPPFGDTLFRPPQPPVPWTGVRECTAYGPICPQAQLMAGVPFVVDPGEDCLSVNVWASTDTTPAAGAPVMVWIHGGAFLYGSGADPMFDGSRFARSGIVLVTINYRLGALGLLHAGSLDDDFAEASGAYTVADQVAALTWVRDNIAQFGGDPDNVTVFGESAGGTFVGTLLGCPAAEGLFRRAVAQSPAGGGLFGYSPEMAAGFARLLVDDLGGLDALRHASPQQIVAAQTALVARTSRGQHRDVVGRHGIPLLPMTGDLLPQAPLAAIAGGCNAGVDVVVGSNRDEMTLFDFLERAPGRAEDAVSFAQPWTDDAEMVERVAATYDRTRDPASPSTTPVAVDSDRTFRLPAVRIAEAHAAAGGPGSTRMYLFTWPSPGYGGILGATHTLEIPFVFGTGVSPMVALVTQGAPLPAPLVDLMHDTWVAFARTGDPAAGDGVTEWPLYAADDRLTMLLDLEPQVVADPAGERRAVWTDAMLMD